MLLFIVLMLLLPFFHSVRVPIHQVSPPNKIHLITGAPYSFVNTVKYCHNYPDIVCYERPGNGFTSGDETALTFISQTDAAGLGSLHIMFPRRSDAQNNDADGKPDVNGLFHCYNYKHIFGIQVLVTAFHPSVRFRDGLNLLYVEDVPKSRWSQDLFVDFSGLPYTDFVFAVVRTIIWESPPTCTPCDSGDPTGDPVHDEL